MGVRGLTSYIEKHADLYLTSYKLHNTNLVIDGNNLAAHIYKWVSKSNSAFGGDYDEYAFHVYNFFVSLRKCLITPVVIFDGGYEEKKLPTVLSRLKNKLSNLESISNVLISNIKHFPLFMKQVFIEVLLKLNILHVQCDFEADCEIAVVGRMLQCPVLSYDSDFYVFNVLYIPFSSMCLEPIRVEKDGFTYYYLKCSLYDCKNFLKHFQGLQSIELPILAYLVGNDYIESKVFDSFSANIKKSKKPNETTSEKKIVGFLNWLKKESFESALYKVLKQLNKKDAEKVNSEIREIVENFNCVTSIILKVVRTRTEIVLPVPDVHMKSTLESVNFKRLLRNCLIPSFMVDMLSLKTYFLPPQVEENSSPCAHQICFPVILIIFQILHCDLNTLPQLTVYERVKNHLSTRKIVTEKSPFLMKFSCYDDILKEDISTRCNILFHGLNLEEADKQTLMLFPEEWKLYALGVIYWGKNVQGLTTACLGSVIWSLIGTWFINQKIGFYQTLSRFRKHTSSSLGKITKTQIQKYDCCDMSSLMNLIAEDDCLLLGELFISMHLINDKLRTNTKHFYHHVIHKFAQFQSCLYHISYLNALLDFPLQRIEISRLYSGTLIYNLYLSVKNKSNVLQFVSSLLLDSPNLCSMYNQVFCALSPYFITNKEAKPKRKSKVHRRHVNSNSYAVVDLESSEDEYDETNNRFAVLRTF